MKGIEMNTLIVSQHEELHESLRSLVLAATSSDIRGNFAGPAPLREGDSHWIDQDEKRFFEPTAVTEGFVVVRTFDIRTGEEMHDRKSAPEGWWEEQLGGWPGWQAWARSMPNTYVVNGDYLMVSGGSWVITGMTKKGNIEFTSWSKLRAESQAEEDAERADWLSENAEAIAAVQPVWANPDLTYVDLAPADDLDPDLVEFRRDVGTVAIEQSCHIDDGVSTLAGEPQIRVIDSLDDHSVFSLDEAEKVSFDAFSAACLVRGNILDDEATVSDLFRIARSFKVNPSAVWALDESNLSPVDLIASKIRRAADLLEEVAALEESAETDEGTLADAMRPHLVRIGVALGDISVEDVATSGVTR